MNPYLPIRKVPLDYNGVKSSSSYMLLPNEEVKKAAKQVAEECNIEFVHDKTFFNGRQYIYSMRSPEVVGSIDVDDDVALGMQFWNSYDGSKSFGYSLMLFRLVCTNGMISKDYFSTYKFKHEPTSENWDENLNQVVRNINSMSNGGYKLKNLYLILES